MRHSRMIHAVLRQLGVPARDQPDVMQEIFLSAWRSVKGGGFRPRPEVPPKNALQSWLFAVTWHHVFHYRKRLYRWYRELAAFAASVLTSHVQSSFSQVDTRLALRYLKRLTPELRAVLAGTALGYTCNEIAAKLGGSPLATHRRLHRGRKQLREVLRRARCWRSSPSPGARASRSTTVGVGPLT